MAVLVIAEHNHAALNPAVYSLVTAAQKIGGDIDIMIAAQEGGKQHAANTVDFGCFFCKLSAFLSGDHDVDVAADLLSSQNQRYAPRAAFRGS